MKKNFKRCFDSHHGGRIVDGMWRKQNCKLDSYLSVGAFRRCGDGKPEGSFHVNELFREYYSGSRCN